MKPGIKTTEFYIALAVVVLGALPQVYDSSDIAQLGGLIAMALASAGYGFARSKAKEVV